MILFYEDMFETYDGDRPVIHKESTNMHFQSMPVILNRMGVKNNIFFMTLLDTDLAKYDPHKLNDPSAELAYRIGRECCRNPWYAIREICRIPMHGQISGTPFRLNRANLALLWCFLNDINTMLTQPRQTGKSIGFLTIDWLLMYFLGRTYTLALLTRSTKLVNSSIATLKGIRDLTPSYLIYKSKQDTDNKEGLTYSVYNNSYGTHVALADPRAADALGRGFSVAGLRVDEVAADDNIHITLPSALSATDAARQNARDNGLPGATIYATTAGQLDDPSGRYAFELVKNAMPFSENLYDLRNKTELVSILNKNSVVEKLIYIVYSYLQLGFTKEWFNTTAYAAGRSQDTIDKDYLNIWKMGTSSSIISQEMLTKIKMSEKEPIHTEITEHGYIVRWYRHPSVLLNSDGSSRSLIMGTDASENIGKDFTSFVILDPMDMAVVAQTRCNESNLMVIAEFVVDMILKYSKLLWIPERNLTGTAILDYVILKLNERGINAFTRIYNRVVDGMHDEFKNTSATGPVEGSVRKYFGFRTTAASDSRKVLYKEVLLKTLELNHERINDPTLINEITSLTVRNGRVDHVGGGHDDTVIAYLLCCWLIFHGKNLHIYGIDVSKVLSLLDLFGKKLNPGEREYQIKVRQSISSIEAKLRMITHEGMKLHLNKELRHYQSLLDENINVSSNISISKNTSEAEEFGLQAKRGVDHITGVQLLSRI